MSVGAKLITLELGLLVAYLHLLRRRLAAHARGDGSLAPGATQLVYSALPAILGVVSLGLAIYPAVLLSRTWISPLAAGPMTSLAFLSTALLMGTSATVLLSHLVAGVLDGAFEERVRRTLIFLISVQAMVLSFDYLSSPSDRAAMVSMGVFQVVVVWLGLALPAAIFLALPGHRIATMMGATASLIGAGVLRYLFFAVR
jgi:hypothetical protein